jgi:hypothetical protein
MASFKFADAFKFFSFVVSFFKYLRPPPMDDHATHLLDPNSATQTHLFRLVLRGWGSEFCESNPDIKDFLSQIEVTCIMHNKMPRSPEHEYLIIETRDRLGNIKPLILERTVGLPGDGDTSVPSPPGEGPIRLYKQIKQIACETLMSGFDPNLASMEEGSLPKSSFSSLSVIDRATLSSTQSADLLSESIRAKLDDLHDSPAVDQFLGEKYVFSVNWHGQYIRHLKPKKPLSLFELAILADVVHTQFPKYKLLREQCYYFSGLIYSVIEFHFGVQDSSSSSESATWDEDQLVRIDGSHLSNRFGRYKGALLTNIKHQEVVEMVTKYEKAFDFEIAKVTYYNISMNSSY